MKLIRPQDLFTLTKPGHELCLTVYLNQGVNLSCILDELDRLKRNDPEIEKANSLMKKVVDFVSSSHWAEQGKTVGFFVTSSFEARIELPFKTKEIIVVSASFHIKPLLKWIQREKPFYLLQINNDSAELFLGTLSSLFSIKQFEVKALKSIQRQVQQFLKTERYPLLIEGDVHIASRYCDISKYKPVVGYFEFKPKTNQSLHLQAVDALEPYHILLERKIINEYRAAKAKKKTCTSLSEIAKYALAGEVQHLFVNENLNIWGHLDYRDGTFLYQGKENRSSHDDILDDLAEVVRFMGGEVTVLPSDRMPESNAVSAILQNKKNGITRLQKLTHTMSEAYGKALRMKAEV